NFSHLHPFSGITGYLFPRYPLTLFRQKMDMVFINITVFTIDKMCLKAFIGCFAYCTNRINSLFLIFSFVRTSLMAFEFINCICRP
ncbi:hypothetical protein, partial [Arsenophonus sp.]|uniref:hypothetical protein n=1 Tax=Arsenophonus sp. TaxID=1872640 RepID=UPI00285D828E